MPIAATEGMLVPRPAPGPAFWLLALFGFPAFNTALFYLDSADTLPDLVLPDIFGLLAFSHRSRLSSACLPTRSRIAGLPAGASERGWRPARRSSSCRRAS
jgi:hypothetical protein